MPNNIIMADAKGNELYYSSSGIAYSKKMELPKIWQGKNYLYEGCTKLKELICNETSVIGGSSHNTIVNYFNKCRELEIARFPFLQGIGSSFVELFFGNCTSLREAQFGSIGHPVSTFDNTNYEYKVFGGCIQRGLTITIYVDANTLSDVPDAVSHCAPWGATNATIIYRNSTTGEVIME